MVAAVAKRSGQGIARGSSGIFTGDGSVATVTIGFYPKMVKLVNLTDVVVWEKTDGMSDAQCLKTVAAGTLTLDTSSAVILTPGGFIVSAAAAIAAKNFTWYAE